MESGPGDEKTHLPSPTLWPIGFAIGLAALLVGLIVSWVVVAIGAAIAVVFGLLWVIDLSHAHGAAKGEPPPVAEAAPAGAPPEAPAEPAAEPERFPRNRFLEGTTLGLGALIGGLIMVPSLGLVAASGIEGQTFKDVDLGPLSNFPEGQFIITTFVEDPAAGEVSRRTAYIRYNGLLGELPSFTILSNRCAHLGCPVQPNGPVASKPSEVVVDKQGNVVRKLTPAKPAGFGCPCHGGQYDTEGNRIAGPPVRALDRYEYSIVHGRLVLGSAYSVAKVKDTGKDAKIKKELLHNPGQHVEGPEAWLWPIPEIRT